MDTQRVGEQGGGSTASREHLEEALAATDDAEARYHIRQAMQILEIEAWR